MEPDNHLFLEKGNVHLPNLHFLGERTCEFSNYPLQNNWWLVQMIHLLFKWSLTSGDIRSFSGTVDGSEIRLTAPVEGKAVYPKYVYKVFPHRPNGGWERGFLVAINNISNIFYFHPEPWGRFSPNFDGCIFFRWVGENPPTIPIGSMYGIYMDPMGYSSSSRLS